MGNVKDNDRPNDAQSKDTPGYPIYPPEEDIYSKERKAKNIDPTDILGEENQSLSSDLDVPGADLDDKQEAIGAEDEENNYYSLGGDDHNDLEEDRA